MSKPNEDGKVNVRIEIVNGQMVVKILGYEGGLSCSLHSEQLVKILATKHPRGFGKNTAQPELGLTNEGRMTQGYETPEQIRGTNEEENVSSSQNPVPDWMKHGDEKQLDGGYGV